MATSSIDTFHPTSSILSLTYDYAGLNGAGAATFAIQANTDGTTVDSSYNTPGANGVAWDYNAYGVLTAEQLYAVSGEVIDYQFDPTGSWVTQQVATGTTYKQVSNYAAANTLSELTDNYSSGATYVGYYGTGSAGDPLTQTISGTPGVAIVTSDFDAAAAGDPIGAVQVQNPNGAVTDYSYAETQAGDPLLETIQTVPNDYVVTSNYDTAVGGDPLDQMIYQSANGAVDKAAYDVSGGSWSSAVADYNPSGVEIELETNYTNNTAINQLFNGQAQGWIGQEFWYTQGLITQNTITFDSGVSEDLKYAGDSLYTYLINNPGIRIFADDREPRGPAVEQLYQFLYACGLGHRIRRGL